MLDGLPSHARCVRDAVEMVLHVVQHLFMFPASDPSVIARETLRNPSRQCDDSLSVSH